MKREILNGDLTFVVIISVEMFFHSKVDEKWEIKKNDFVVRPVQNNLKMISSEIFWDYRLDKQIFFFLLGCR